MSSAYGMLGNIDANTGDAQVGWDTDQARDLCRIPHPRDARKDALLALPQSHGTLECESWTLACGALQQDAATACSCPPPCALTCRAAYAQFLTDPREATLIGLAILKQGGLAPGVQGNPLQLGSSMHELTQCDEVQSLRPTGCCAP